MLKLNCSCTCVINRYMNYIKNSVSWFITAHLMTSHFMIHVFQHSQFSGDILTLYDGYSIFEYPCLEQVYNRFNPIRKHRIPIEEPYANSITTRIPKYSKDKEWTHLTPLF
ncbi:Uncharacterized protein APZ42_008020 [Daphnia magna]|uniref:Uncharacterized protein n=1 Tax=Daphnia magna TaxID=35525 RepID=A0A164EXN7_9CRUS|nr:Uncharacterized protein APZ42_008020 [Daphnia magna]